MTKPAHIKSGIWAEELASAFLQKKGIEVLYRNWRHKRSEIDIIIKTKRGVAFVEVKYRKKVFFGEPDLAITQTKMNKMQEAAQGFMELFIAFEEVRFDILSVSGAQDNPQIHYFEDAFFPDNLNNHQF